MAQHRKGTLTHARARAKAALQRMPLGSVVMVGQWIDTGEYVAKAGGGMSWAHERFRPVEQWASVPKVSGIGRKLIKLEVTPGTRRNPRKANPKVTSRKANPKVTYRLENLLAPRFMGISEIQFAIAEVTLGNLKVGSYERTMTGLVKELEKRTGVRYGTFAAVEPLEKWHASLPSGERRRLRARLKKGAEQHTSFLTGARNPRKANPGRQDPAVRLAIADATRILGRVPRNLRGRR